MMKFIALPLTIYFFFNHREKFINYCLLGAMPAILLILYSLSYHGSVLALGQGQGIGGFHGNIMEGFIGLLISPARGLFVFSPFLIFSLFYFHKSFRKKENPINKYLVISFILLILIYSKWGMWWGGHSFGYRLIIETLPLLIVLLGYAWNEIISKNSILRGIFFALVIYSIFFNYLGTYIYPSGFNYIPNNIDQNTERLWEIKNTELLRCINLLLGQPAYSLTGV